MRRVALTGGQVLSPSGSLVKGALLIEETQVAGIVQDAEIVEPREIVKIDVSGCIVAPGLIDTHVHGGGGHNFMEGTGEAVFSISRHMARVGVTSCLATTTSAPLPALVGAIEKAVSVMQNRSLYDVEVLGVHLEGPYIKPKSRGVHVEYQIRNATASELKTILATAGSALRVVTLAPEMPYGLEATRFLASHGICVSIGHTALSYDEAKNAIANGIVRGTHMFNAMPPIHHRNSGPIPALFEASNAMLEFIVDGHHVHPSVIAMAIGMAGVERIVLVTDCTDVAGQGEGVLTRWEGTEVVVKEGQSRTLAGSLAGSILNMHQGVQNLVNLVGLPIEWALRMAAENPAKSVGVYDRKGSLAPGKDADILVLRQDLSINLTISRGKIVYESKTQAGF